MAPVTVDNKIMNLNKINIRKTLKKKSSLSLIISLLRLYMTVINSKAAKDTRTAQQQPEMALQSGEGAIVVVRARFRQHPSIVKNLVQLCNQSPS